MDDNLKKVLEKMHYSIVGENSGVQVCLWTKKSLQGKGGCWKEKFYGVSSASCCQFSPCVMNCENQCLHCWRPIELNRGIELGEMGDVKKLLDKIIEKRKSLLMGLKGNAEVDKKDFEEALVPKLFTFSLSGEPTLYLKLPEMVKEIRGRGAVSFIVTNGQNPDMIKKLERKEALPTQLTLSTNAPNEKLFKIWHRSLRKDSWERFNKTMEIIKNLKGKCRRVIRLTLVKKGTEDSKYKNLTNMSDENVSEYVSVIKEAQPDFVHVKGFKSVGYARERFGYDKMPWFSEVQDYANKILKELKKFDENWKVLGEDEYPAVVLLGKNKKMMKIKA